jgi:peptidoglycan/LPS O-acetylase OafA/YrhL
MKHLFILAGLLAAASPAAAQASAPSTQPAAMLASPAPAAPDTAAAIHRLFAAKRKRQGYVVGATVVAAVGTAGVVAANRPTDLGTSSGFGVIAPNNLDLAMVGIVAVPVVLAEALFLGGWGHKYERQVLATWQQQHQLPRAVKRRLAPRYFQ